MTYRKLAIGLWILAGLLMLFVGLLYTAGYRVTLTPSLPRGIYRQSSVDTNPLQRGQIVSFCPPDTAIFQEAKRRGYIPSGYCPGSYMPLFKPVVALPGDTVEVSSLGISVNGRLLKNSRLQLLDRKERRMRQIPKSIYKLPPNFVWLISTHHPQSFDSRYFGAVSTDNITGFLLPVWTEGTKS
jgi:conjugative transfer signal peptidase TraF